MERAWRAPGSLLCLPVPEPCQSLAVRGPVWRMLSSIPPRAGRHSLLALGVALFGASGLACNSGGSTPAAPAASNSRPPNVVLITLDTTRADHLGSYGHKGAETPNLDRVAAAGVRFERALSPVPLTLPAHASLMTGRYPFTHGVRNNGHFVCLMTANTRRRTRGPWLRHRCLRQLVRARSPVRAQSGVRALRRWARRGRGGRGNFGRGRASRRSNRGRRRGVAPRSGPAAAGPAVLRLGAPLRPARTVHAASPFRERFAGRLYDGEIAFADALVGRVLDTSGFGQAPGPLVIVAPAIMASRWASTARARTACSSTAPACTCR